jgi:hypothetical protein
MAPVLVPLRPSNEHILIVRVPGARDQHGCHSIPFIVGALRARRTVCLLPRILLRPRVARAQGTARLPRLLLRLQQLLPLLEHPKNRLRGGKIWGHCLTVHFDKQSSVGARIDFTPTSTTTEAGAMHSQAMTPSPFENPSPETKETPEVLA